MRSVPPSDEIDPSSLFAPIERVGRSRSIDDRLRIAERVRWSPLLAFWRVSVCTSERLMITDTPRAVCALPSELTQSDGAFWCVLVRFGTMRGLGSVCAAW